MPPRNTTHLTALCIIPPENLWKPIQEIRSVHDKAYARWMPHINLLYPFVPESEFDQVKEKLENILAEKAPFDIEFDTSSFHYFEQKGQQCTFHLRPKVSEKVIEIQKLICDAFSDDSNSTAPSFEAHLTLGQVPKFRISDVIIEMKSKWTPMRFKVDRLSMISRQDDPNAKFSVKKQLFLLGRPSRDDDQSHQDQLPTPSPEPISMPTTPVKKSPPPLTSKLSLCIVPPNEFSTRLLHLFEHIPSFSASQPFRIVLKEFDQHPNIVDLDAQLIQIPKFTMTFGSKSICYNYSTGRLFLNPSNPLPAISVVGFNEKSDNTLTLGSLEKKDLTEIGELYTQRWTSAINEFEVDRVHLLNNHGRFLSSFRLKSQCFS